MNVSIPAGLSVSEAKLLEHVIEHVRAEVELLSAYRRVADEADAPWVSYLTEIIVEEETRHHRYFEDLAKALRAPVERDIEDGVPTVTTVSNARQLMKATDELLAAERADARALRRLSRRLRLMRGLSVWPLLVTLMERDTEKHIGILRFIRRQLRDQRD